MMRISTEIGSAAEFVGERRAVELVGKAGFDAWDLTLFDLARWDWSRDCIAESNHIFTTSECVKYVRELRNIGEAYGMVCNQSHAPFPTYGMSKDILKRSIELTAEAGGDICIIHPNNCRSAEENAEMYRGILPFAKEYGVKIATENMWNWDKGSETSTPAACSSAESFVKHIDLVGDDFLVGCLDIGHAEMRGSGDGAAKMIRALGKRLQALHIHDNDKLHDSHEIPFSMNIDFVSVTDALREIGYSGYLTLESNGYFSDADADSVEYKLKMLADSARRLDAMMMK